jgi:hypothetical protein
MSRSALVSHTTPVRSRLLGPVTRPRTRTRQPSFQASPRVSAAILPLGNKTSTHSVENCCPVKDPQECALIC